MTSSVSKLYVGAKAPESFRLDVVSLPTDDVDLSTVTSAEMHVQLPDGTEVVWTAAILLSPQATASTISIVHVFAPSGLDLVEKGTYKIVGFLTLPAGVVRSEPYAQNVLGQFDTGCCT